MKQQISKDIVVAALLTNVSGEVLIVQPSYKEGWIFPGGHVEVGESPSEAFRREMRAELDLTIDTPTRLLAVDYQGIPEEYVMFIFDGGILSDAQIAAIDLPSLLTEYRFVSPEEALTLLRPNSARRLMPILDARQKTGIAYLEDQAIM